MFMNGNDDEERDGDVVCDEVQIDRSTELIMFFDSNFTYIDKRKLWDLDGTKYVRCGMLDDVIGVIDDSKVKYENLKYFFVSCGCNDLDYTNAGNVFNSMKIIVEKLHNKYPNVKIILSEVTPRMDNIDQKVKSTNFLLEPYVKQTDNVFLTKHSNMRKREFFRDDKHFCKECIPKFAANIKNTLRFVYGRRKFNQETSSANMQQPQNGSFRSPAPRSHSNVNVLMKDVANGDFLRVLSERITSSIVAALQNVG